MKPWLNTLVKVSGVFRPTGAVSSLTRRVTIILMPM